jgi:hypothetical protein
MTKCTWHDVRQLKYLIRDAVDEMDDRFNSLQADWADRHIPDQPAVAWLKDNEGIFPLGDGVYGIPESVGYQVSPNAILLATLDHYIVSYNTLYISRKIEPNLFPFHVMAAMTGRDPESISWGKLLYNEDWERLGAGLSRLLMATFSFVNWRTITLNELNDILENMRIQYNLKPLIVIDDALLLSDWQNGVGADNQKVIHQLVWLAGQHGADLHLVIPQSSRWLS